MTEEQRIVRALDLLLTTAAANRRPWPSRYEGLSSLGDATKRFLSTGKAQRRADAICDDPVGEAMRWAIRSLGERLHQVGGPKAMTDALGAAAALDPARAGWREGFLDKRWDGIGSWYA